MDITPSKDIFNDFPIGHMSATKKNI